ncbi:Rho-GTPase-activating protein 8 [Paramarasmius palmivorus]|uniref:Rho-GTPase-activating protein 8 n=1 Tax=Paramarasmius palmivorus TaxID=297713 RepID=A0AAW0E5S9_9AGAR
MAVLSLPLSFNNSFWTQDYRKGLEVLFHKLEQGLAENDEIIAFVRARAIAEAQLANALSNVVNTGAPGTGFQADDGASLFMTFQGLKAESASQGQIHRSIAKELETLVADPFAEWAVGYRDRLKQSKTVVFDQWLKSYEQSQAEVAKLKQQYLAKTRKADEAEDDARFAPNSVAADHYTTSPRMRPVDGRSPPQRTASVSERIAQRLKEIQMKSVGAFSGDSATSDTAEKLFEADTEKELPKVDKGKGKAVEDRPISPAMLSSPTPMSPLLPPKVDIPPVPASAGDIVLGGVSLPRSAVSQLMIRAASEMNLRPVRFPLLGEYQDCFNGEEFVAWLKNNVPAFEDNLDRAEEAAKELTEKEGLLRRIGEFGNEFEDADDAFYQFRPKAFNFDGKSASMDSLGSPIKTTLQPQNILKSTNNLVSIVSKALATNANGQPAFVKARQEAEEADKAYRIAVRQLDRRRLNLEEKLEESFKTLQRWETERLRAVKTVLLQYQGTLANLPKSLEPSIERQSTLITAYQPESDLTALIERYRTGPFRPHAHMYESIAHDETDILFGIDLRKWAELGLMSAASDDKKDAIPEVLAALLKALDRAYAKLPNDAESSSAEKRKSWIYEVPLANVHHLRETLNAVQPDQPIPPEILEPYDAPVLAAVIKLWLLELEPPLAMYEGWEEFRKLYPSMGAALVIKPEGEDTQESKLRDLGAALQKLPRVHLYVLDAIVSHLRKLIQTTKVEEPDEVYITKLALSIGRTVVRPKVETEISIQDRHPILLFIDLIQEYDTLIPPTITRKKRESERKVPIRKRTAMVDQRLSRSRISVTGVDAKQLLAAQQAAQQGVKSPEKEAPPVPPLPPHIAQPTPVPPPPPPIELASPKSVSPPPLPPATVEAPKPVAAQDPDLPPRPMFREPPPDSEDEDFPPRPAFKTPPPEPEDPSTPPRPNFAEPPPEESDSPSAAVKSRSVSPPSAPTTAVIPPTPENRVKRTSVSPRSGSPAPVSPDEALNPGRASITRSSSGGVRGPRLTRGPRAPGSGNVASMVSNLNRNSVSSGSGSASPTSPTYKRLSGSGSPRRPSSVLGKSTFSRRTMASDAEDDVVDRK